MIDYRIVVAFILMFILLPYLMVTIMVAREERRTLKTLEEAMIKEKYTKHGCWISTNSRTHGYDGEGFYTCSECKGITHFACGAYKSPYCPECGAKMDGDQDE